MALPINGTIMMSQVNLELNRLSNAIISLNETPLRTLFSKPSGPISLSDGYGKTNTPIGEAMYVSGSGLNYFSFIVPTNVTKVSLVAVGGVVTRSSGTSVFAAYGGTAWNPPTAANSGGGQGGSGGHGGGGGAGGYTGSGGNAMQRVGYDVNDEFGNYWYTDYYNQPATAGQGGGGGGGTVLHTNGGGVGVLGQGANGAPNTAGSGGSGATYGGGSGGYMTQQLNTVQGDRGKILQWINNLPVTPGETLTIGLYGVYQPPAGNASGAECVRIIWGTNRSFPSTNTGTL